ncbi:hypothetical protein CC2G_008031 [Coprinopsis cinerea AmutBmut pab1-1]|nr:hypothetical protein CC2G_008031 [Coprinopsis cinerea AmutBmut pab1-1]
MASLFSRSRTFSTPNKKKAALSSRDDGLDEFGRVSGGALSSRSGTAPATPSKKDKKKKAKEQAKRSGTLSSSGADQEFPGESSSFPDGSFLPLNLDRPRNDSDTADPTKQHDYGYLCYERHVVLGLEQLERLVDVVADELETRGGITTPFIFSNTALDISSSGIKRLIHSFIDTCAPSSAQQAQEAENRWREEARFVGPHELGMTLRWGLARVIRSVGGQDVRGLVSYEQYAEWRDSEAANNYPPAHFQTFLPALPEPLQYIIVRLLSLLARLVANSTSSGHTPPTLSPLFGPLFFGLGPATLAFHHAYIHYLRSVNAFEHLLLAFVRWQDTPRSSTASAASLGVPVRLKEWIKGYPAMLPFTGNPKAKPQPRKGARTVRVMSVRRNVRMYSPDLVKSASAWAQKNTHSTLSNSFAQSKEWERIAPSTLKLAPRYSDSYKKKMNMPANFHPDVHAGTYPNANPAPGTAPPVSLSSTLSSLDSSEKDYFGDKERVDDRFRSLTDLKWGEFESMGFSNLGDEKKLQFDLTESARQERAAKRQTLTWNDFSTSGFSRTDAPLSATLQFSTPVVNTVQSWPSQQVEIHRKLKKQQKSLPAFGWDTEPVVGNEEVIEEAFIDVFCDLIYGGGWMDLERGESLDRDCNWALVEYKSLPPSRSTTSGGNDPRTDVTLILYEEFVPLEYRQQLALPSKSRRRLPSLFSPSSKKQWKPAATLNGRPYVVGHVPRSPSYREVEFEGLLQGSGGTKVISLSKRDNKDASAPRVQSTISNAPSDFPKIPPAPSRPPPTIVTPAATTSRTPEPTDSQYHPPPPRSDENPSDSSANMSTPASKKSRFRLPFETRMASYSDDEWGGDANEPEDVKQKRRESRPDAWVDILVGTQSRRMGDQDALDPNERRRRGGVARKSDPDMASLEVAQVLAAVKEKERSLSPTSIPEIPSERVDKDYGMDRHLYDADVDEVETVPRHRMESRSTEDDSGSDAHLAYDRGTNDGHSAEDELMAPILNARQMAKEGRRMGYFDLHPERRAALSGGGAGSSAAAHQEEDPRERLARPSMSDDEGDSEDAYGAPEPRRPLPAPPKPAYETPQKRVVPDIKITTNPEPPIPTTKLASNGHRNGNGVPEPSSSSPAKTPTGTSKTAALIEMYRERERSANAPLNVASIPVAPLNVSRLPVRTASLQRGEQPAGPVPVAPAATLAPTLTPSPSPSPKNSPPEAAGYPLPTVSLEDPGRISPGRYVHGAPLHNVMEEPEEEE